MTTNRILGAIFVLVAGIIYSIERVVSMVSTSIILAGFHAGERTGEVPQIEVSGLFSNIFVPVFLVFGIVLIINSIKKV